VNTQVASPRKIILARSMPGRVRGPSKVEKFRCPAIEVDEQSRLVRQGPTEILVLDAAFELFSPRNLHPLPFIGFVDSVSHV
jgi:hypothetical protein